MRCTSEKRVRFFQTLSKIGNFLSIIFSRKMMPVS